MSLRAAAFSAGRWTTASATLRATLHIAQTMALARLLTPDAFGVMALAGAAIAIAQLLAEMGISSALMHFPTPDHRTLSTLYWINLGLAVVMMALVVALGLGLANVYGQPELVGVMFFSSFVLPLSACSLQFKALAEKAMKFAALARIEVMATVVSVVAALAAAALGAGVYALVVGLLINAAVNAALSFLYLSKGVRPSMVFELSATRPFIGYGIYRIGDSLTNALRMQSDLLIAGALASPSLVGAYAVPRDFCFRIASTVVNPVVTRVGLPLMARVQTDGPALKSIYLQTLRMTASINFPIYAVIALLADEIVFLLLGDQWSSAPIFMQIFAAWGLVRSTANPMGSLLYATGFVRQAFLWNAVLLFATPIIFWLAGMHYGLIGLALAVLATQVGMVIPAWRYLVHPACGASLTEYSKPLLVPLAITLAGAGAGFAALQVADSILARITSATITMSMTYVGLSLVLNREWARSMIEISTPLMPWRK
ncbi:MOP flippase family protein [Luteimonas sp. A501]